MNKNYAFLALILAAASFMAFQNGTSYEVSVAKLNHHKQSGGGQIMLTGAPGENNCTQCHIGTAQDGSNEIMVTFLQGATQVTSYVPGQQYIVSVFLVSSPSKAGFSAVALDGTNSNAGSFTGEAVGGTQDFNSATRHYVSHTSSSSNGSPNPWLWTWTAPATDVGNVTFYVAANEANGNGNTSGDVIYLKQAVINSSAGVVENSLETNFIAGYNVDKNQVTVNFNTQLAGDMTINLVDLNGKSVFTENLGKSSIGENKEVIALPNGIEDGIYVVHFFVDNKSMSDKINVIR